MPATRTARRPVHADQLDLPGLLLPNAPATVDGIPGQLDIVAAVAAAPRLTVNAAAVYDTRADRHCHGRTKAKRRCSDYVVPEWKGSLVLSDGSHWCRQHAHQGWALTR